MKSQQRATITDNECLNSHFNDNLPPLLDNKRDDYHSSETQSVLTSSPSSCTSSLSSVPPSSSSSPPIIPIAGHDERSVANMKNFFQQQNPSVKQIQMKNDRFNKNQSRKADLGDNLKAFYMQQQQQIQHHQHPTSHSAVAAAPPLHQIHALYPHHKQMYLPQNLHPIDRLQQQANVIEQLLNMKDPTTVGNAQPNKSVISKTDYNLGKNINNTNNNNSNNNNTKTIESCSTSNNINSNDCSANNISSSNKINNNTTKVKRSYSKSFVAMTMMRKFRYANYRNKTKTAICDDANAKFKDFSIDSLLKTD